MTESFSPADARRFVGDHYGDRAGALSSLSGGEWSRAYAFTLDGEVVIRFGEHHDDFAKDQRMAAHAGPSLPVPAVLEVGEAPTGFFAVSRRVRGRMLDTLDGTGMRRILPAVFAALDALHDVDVSHTQGYGLWDGDGTGPHRTWVEALLAINADRDRLPGWRAALQSSPTGTGVFDAAYETLRDLATVLPQVRQVIHSDLLHHNVLVDGAAITGVLDWANALYGDYLYDAAWLLYWWPWYPQWADIDIRTELERHWMAHGGLPGNLEHRLRAYQLHIGLDAMAYTAFTHRWGDLQRNAEQLTGLIEGS